LINNEIKVLKDYFEQLPEIEPKYQNNLHLRL